MKAPLESGSTIEPQVTLDALTKLGTKSVTIVGGIVAVCYTNRRKEQA